MNKKTKVALLAFTLIFGAVILNSCSGPQQVALSQESIESLTRLNQKYALEMSTIHSKSSALDNQLLNANLLGKETKNDHQGFILKIASKNEMDYFTLNPPSKLSEEKIKKIAQEYSQIPEVKNVEIDQTIVLFGNEPEALNLKNNLDQESDKEDVLAKEKIKIAILDTGIDSDHELFKNFTIHPGWNSVKKNRDTEDDVGHGTHIAGIIAQSKVPIEIIPYKVVDRETGRLSHVISALEKLENEKVDIINMSFGFVKHSEILEDLIQKEHEKGIIIVAAAGNQNASQPVYPAAYDEVIAVGAVNVIGRTLKNSNYGGWVDVAALGYYVNSALPENQYGYQSGTSQATASVTAYLAQQLREGEFKNTKEFLMKFKNNSPKVPLGNLKGIPMI